MLSIMSNAHYADAAVTKLRSIFEVIDDTEVGTTQGVPSLDAKQGDRTNPPLDGSLFHDQIRFHSSEISRAFVSVLRAVSQGAQTEALGPDEVSLGPEVAISDVEIVRGVD